MAKNISKIILNFREESICLFRVKKDLSQGKIFKKNKTKYFSYLKGFKSKIQLIPLDLKALFT